MKVRLHPKIDFWDVDRGLNNLLVLLVVGIFVVHPFMRETQGGEFLVTLIFAGILLTGIHSVGIAGYGRIAAYSVAVISIAAQLISVLWRAEFLMLVEAATRTIAMGILDAVILYRVFSPGPINANRIKGSIAGYIVVGLMFTGCYEMVETFAPGAIQLNGQGLEHLRSTLMYFSFVSLTTMGYGDIVPVDPVARSLAMLEGLIGQLYPAILIGRLISMADWGQRD